MCKFTLFRSILSSYLLFISRNWDVTIGTIHFVGVAYSSSLIADGCCMSSSIERHFILSPTSSCSALRWEPSRVLTLSLVTIIANELLNIYHVCMTIRCTCTRLFCSMHVWRRLKLYSCTSSIRSLFSLLLMSAYSGGIVHCAFVLGFVNST